MPISFNDNTQINTQINNELLCVVCNHKNYIDEATRFASKFNLELFEKQSRSHELQLVFTEDKIELFDNTLNTSICVDFLQGSTAHRERFGGGKGQTIAKAIGLKKFNKPTVIDTTAGLAGDAYVLATLGCQLILLEQSPVLFTLINDAINRVKASETIEHPIENFIDLINTDSEHYLETIEASSKPDVIYIDPMYPERKKSALVKKDMQILHKLIGSPRNEERLLELALRCAKHRVVVKRPVTAEPIEGAKPTLDLSSKKTRYDIYVLA